MAILEELEVSIIVNESLAPEFEEHGIDSNNPAKSIKFIEAADDVPFRVRIATRDSMATKATSLLFETYIDGNMATSTYFSKKRHLLHPKQKDVSGVIVKGSAGWELRPFLFRAVNTGESDHILLIPASLLIISSGRV